MIQHNTFTQWTADSESEKTDDGKSNRRTVADGNSIMRLFSATMQRLVIAETKGKAQSFRVTIFAVKRGR